MSFKEYVDLDWRFFNDNYPRVGDEFLCYLNTRPTLFPRKNEIFTIIDDNKVSHRTSSFDKIRQFYVVGENADGVVADIDGNNSRGSLRYDASNTTQFIRVDLIPVDSALFQARLSDNWSPVIRQLLMAHRLREMRMKRTVRDRHEFNPKQCKIPS